MVGGGRRAEGSVWEMEEAHSDEPGPCRRASEEAQLTSATSVSDPDVHEESASDRRIRDAERAADVSPPTDSNVRITSERYSKNREINGSDEPEIGIEDARRVPPTAAPTSPDESTGVQKNFASTLNSRDNGAVETDNVDYLKFVGLLKDPEINKFLWRHIKTDVVRRRGASVFPSGSLETDAEPDTDSRDKTTESTKLFCEGIVKTSMYLIVLAVLVTQVFLFVHLYDYISRVERRVPQCRFKRDSGDNAVLKQDSANVEFFNPKIRQELEDKERAQQNATGEQNNWVWLTSYSRIPVSTNSSVPKINPTNY